MTAEITYNRYKKVGINFYLLAQSFYDNFCPNPFLKPMLLHNGFYWQKKTNEESLRGKIITLTYIGQFRVARRTNLHEAPATCRWDCWLTKSNHFMATTLHCTALVVSIAHNHFKLYVGRVEMFHVIFGLPKDFNFNWLLNFERLMYYNLRHNKKCLTWRF